MRLERHFGLRFAGGLLLAMLLLVPLLESGHSHVSRELARPCATCVVAHHSPAAVAPPIAVTLTTAAAASTIVTSGFAPARRSYSSRRGRAPPVPSLAVSL